MGACLATAAADNDINCIVDTENENSIYILLSMEAIKGDLCLQLRGGRCVAH